MSAQMPFMVDDYYLEIKSLENILTVISQSIHTYSEWWDEQCYAGM